MSKQKNPGTDLFQLVLFGTVTFIWSWGLWGLLLANPWLQPHSSTWSCIYVAALSGPLVGATVASFFNREEGAHSLARKLRFPRCRWEYFVVAALLPPAAWIASSFLVHGQFSFAHPWWVLLIIWGKMLVRGGPLTEEIGWRGFLLPQLLTRMNLFWASITIVPVWGLWHLPLWWLPGVPHHDWSFGLFLLLLAPTTLLFSWFYVRGNGRVWLPILFHTSINFALHFSAVEPSTRSGPAFVVLLGIFWCCAAGLVLLKRSLWFAPVRSIESCPDPVSRQEFVGYLS